VEKNTQKNCKKSHKNDANPHGTGVMRFYLASILFTTRRPLSITEIKTLLQVRYPSVSRRWVGRVIEEIKIMGADGLPLQSSIKRSSRTKCAAYYIEPIKKAKIQYELW
jgi:hypothetical protein